MLDLSTLLAAPRDVWAVPVLDEAAFNLGKYRDGSALKFRGVVRDVHDPELVQLSTRTEFVERVPLTVTLFPHASDWATKAYISVVHKNSSESDGPSTSTNEGVKRSIAAVDETQMDDGGHAEDTQAKKPKAVEDKQTTEDTLLLPEAVNIYVYDGQYKETPLTAFKVNEAFEFVGLLDLMVPGSDTKKEDAENVMSAKQLEELQISDRIDEMQRKTRSGVVLHCCNASGMESVHHVRPHESAEFYKQILESNDSMSKFCLEEWKKLGQEVDVAAMRKQIVDYLTRAVNGDKLAAEYLLLALLSHVYSRADPSTPLGNLSLNLALDKQSTTEQKEAFIKGIQKTLKSLMPMVARVDLSLKELNSTKFMPHKDYDREILLNGVLQVANGTTMLVNETALTAGQLNEQGVKNIAALQSLVDKMLLPYDFHYYNMDFPQNVAVVTVSEGKSILPVTAAVPIVASDGANEEQSLPEDHILECFRVFLSVLRSFTVSIGNEGAEMAEQHYVECHKSQQQVVLEDLHRWLRIARLVALSRGEGQISKDSWDAMVALETQRLARNPSDNIPERK